MLGINLFEIPKFIITMILRSKNRITWCLINNSPTPGCISDVKIEFRVFGTRRAVPDPFAALLTRFRRPVNKQPLVVQARDSSASEAVHPSLRYGRWSRCVTVSTVIYGMFLQHLQSPTQSNNRLYCWNSRRTLIFLINVHFQPKPFA